MHCSYKTSTMRMSLGHWEDEGIPLLLLLECLTDKWARVGGCNKNRNVEYPC